LSLKRHPYAPFLHRVAKPARYTGGETNQIVKDPASVRVRMALGFPDVYDIGMSHLGTKILYSLLNRHPDIAAERVFCPWIDMERELRDRGLPLLSLETASPLTDFDVVGFSLQYELTFTNVLTMLDLASIPFRSADRDERHPLVIAGGPVATQPEPMAPFIDAFLIGDAEEKLPEMLLLVADMKANNVPRQEQLKEIARLGGFYVPALYATEEDPRTGFVVVGAPQDDSIPAKPRRQVVQDIDRYPFPDDAPVAAAEAIFDRMAIEIARGCTEGCRFCQAGMIYRPVRERDPEGIVDTIVSAVKKGGYDEVGLTTLSTADYSCISPLIKQVMGKLRQEKVSLSVASLRAYGLDEDLLDEIKSVRATGLTFAPEAGTQRMRDVINKNISEEDLDRTAHRVFGRGWRRMKLYFIVGLPTETDEDVTGIMELGRRMKRIGAQYHKPAAVGITVSVSSHVPKPHTPFQWCAMDSLEEIERKQDVLRDLARRYRLEFRRHDPRTTYLECILGRGDRRLADVIEHVWRAGGRFDSWDDQLRWDAWVAAMQAHPGIPYELFLGTLPVDGRLPWDHLDMGLEERFLATEYRRALRSKLSPPCGKPVGAKVHHTNLADHEADSRILVCYHCGVECDMTRMRDERGRFLEKLGAYRPPQESDAFVSTSDLTGAEREMTAFPRGNSASAGEPERTRRRADVDGPVAAARVSDASSPRPQGDPLTRTGRRAGRDEPAGGDLAGTDRRTPSGEPAGEFTRVNTGSTDSRDSDSAAPPSAGKDSEEGTRVPRRIHDPQRDGRKPHDFQQGEPQRYRVRFAKFSVAALTGHLDLVRALPRVLRRAGVNPYYSEGFHPKPVMEFSPPLPLGLVSLDEVVDLSLAERLPAGELLDRLRAHAPEGLEFLAVERLPKGARKLSRELAAAEYLVRVDADQLARAAGSLDDAPARFLAQAGIPWLVTRKRREKTVDLRPEVDDVKWLAADQVPPELAVNAGFLQPGARYLAVRVRLDTEGHARPEEVAAAVLGFDPGFEAPHLARTRLLKRGPDGWLPVVPDAAGSPREPVTSA